MGTLKERLKAIWFLLKGGQYAVYVMNKGYKSEKETPNKCCCYISDNATGLFLDTVIKFTIKVRKGEVK